MKMWVKSLNPIFTLAQKSFYDLDTHKKKCSPTILGAAWHSFWRVNLCAWVSATLMSYSIR